MWLRCVAAPMPRAAGPAVPTAQGPSLYADRAFQVVTMSSDANSLPENEWDAQLFKHTRVRQLAYCEFESYSEVRYYVTSSSNSLIGCP